MDKPLKINFVIKIERDLDKPQVQHGDNEHLNGMATNLKTYFVLDTNVIKLHKVCAINNTLPAHLHILPRYCLFTWIDKEIVPSDREFTKIRFTFAVVYNVFKFFRPHKNFQKILNLGHSLKEMFQKLGSFKTEIELEETTD